ncbi:MAG: translation initiation factor IF-2 [Saccharofermentanales bacterium]|jgi:translation initiation factor IF-2
MAQIKRESDSGLRAGFIREDDVKKTAQVSKDRESSVNETDNKAETAKENLESDVKSEKAEEVKTPPEIKRPEFKKPEGPKVSLQGISGREITGVVKVVKKVPAAPAKHQPETVTEPEQADAKTTVQAVRKAEQTPGKAKSEIPIVPEEIKPVDVTASSESAPTESVTDTEVTPEKMIPASPEKIEAAKKSAVTEQVVAKTEEVTAKTESTESHQVPASVESVAADRKPVKASKDSSITESSKVSDAEFSKPKTDKKPVDKAAVKKSEPRKPKLIVDRGITESSFDGPRIRPQKGNYVGKNREVPVADQRRTRSGDGQGRTTYQPRGERLQRGDYQPRGERSRPQQRDGEYQPRGERPQRSEYQSRGARTSSDYRRQPDVRRSGGTGFVQDKDREEAPRISRSPRQKRQDPRYEVQLNPEITENAKVDFRKQHDKRASGAKTRRQSDYERRREARDRSLEQERLKETRRQRRENQQRPQVAQTTNVKLPEVLTVRELAELLKKTTADVISKLMTYGVMATLNQEIDYGTAEVIANDFGIKAEKIIEVTEEDILFDDSEDAEEDLETRPPVVVVMGHVDHGKTSILDYIRDARVTEGEAGGITQHIGAYTVDVDGQPITFLDTPGHEAFTTMRARGAQVTDIAVLVVAADDGVMPQTVEAIHHARAADTEIIVAINKIDKQGINLDRVKQELAQHELITEDWGGSTTMVEVSAKTGQNMDELLEMIVLTAQVMDLKANPNRQAKGTVIESKLDRGRGPVATILVQRGTLKVGDTVVVGSTIGNIRAMTDDRGHQVEQAGPSIPVEILGLPDVPESGDIFYAVKDDKIARSLAARRQEEEREAALRKTSRMSLDNLFAQIEQGEVKDFNLIVKGDVQGSVEAVQQSLEKLSNEEVKIRVIHGAVGAITESDVRLAEVSNAVIIGFNVRPAAGVQDMANQANVDLRMYRVIYDAINDIEDAMKGMLDPKFKEVVLGHAEVRETFNVSGLGTIGGCYVTDGTVSRAVSVRIVRDGVVIHEGKISSLRRFKDDVREVSHGYECGIGIERYNDIKIGDQIEAYEMQEVARV